MADLAQSFHSYAPSLYGIAAFSAPSSSSAAFDDSVEDSCSICLEPFSTDDPASMTKCKHEYHLHCILEWYQRSSECPICGRMLALCDPSSQELLAPVEAERNSRRRNVSPTFFTDSPEHDTSNSYDSGLDEDIVQHLVVLSRDRYRYARGREGQRSRINATQILVFNSAADPSSIQPAPSLESGSNYPVPVAPSGVNIGPSPSGIGNDTAQMDIPFEQRVLYGQRLAETPGKVNTPEVLAFPESIKSKFSAASARYKESISKSTRSLRERLLVHNSSVKELSKGVQREMNASIAGLTRMIERLELSSKRTPPSSPAASCNGGSSSTALKGKNIQEHVHAQSPSEDKMVFVPDLSAAAPSNCSSMVSCPMEVRPAHL